MNVLLHISQWNLACSFIQSYEFFIRIQVLFSNPHVKLDLLSHIPQWNLVCSSIQNTFQNGRKYLTGCQTESLVAFLIMEPSVLFHSKLWMLNWWTNWIFCLISHNGIFIKSYLSAWIPGGFVWIFDLYGFHYGYEFKSCPFKVRCQIESFVTYLTMQFCFLFHSKLLAT